MRSLLVCLLAAVASAQTQNPPVRSADRPTTSGENRFFVGNRVPLAPNPLIKLPLGSIRPEGWLRRQLELEAKGFSGRLEEISQFCKYEGNEWTSPAGHGKFGWEEVPYWLRGYIDLGYVLQDPVIIKRAGEWVEAVLKTQRSNGYFGSQSNVESERVNGRRSRMLDLWPNMVMLFPLRSLYEATGDPRILPFMTKYFRWQTTIPLEDFLPGSWQKQRGGDSLDSILWLYNRTGDAFLLDLARVTHERTADWSGGIASWHNVNFAECFREPAQFFQLARDSRYIRATVRNYEDMMRLYGQVPGGGFASDENARPGFNGPRNGTETCAWAEMMYSDQLLVSITGNAAWADRAEEIAFNSFPASMTPDLKGLHYITSPNQVQLDRGNKAPMIENSGDMFRYDPYGHRCCQHNAAFGWPYFSEHLWMATRDQSIAAVMYAPSVITAKVGAGTAVKITETTNYPFDDTIAFTMQPSATVRFPLHLRVPAWSARPELAVNGRAIAVPQVSRGWLIVEREWKAGDKLTLTLPMKTKVRTWKENRNTVSVDRGPLTYALKIGERWVSEGGTNEWPAQEVYATTPWNYGLVYDPVDPSRSFEVVKTGKTASQPFTPDDAPIVLKAKGRRIPQWKLEPNGMVGEVQPGPIRSDQPIEDLTLIPMWAARLRISSFPQIGDGPSAREWDGMAPMVLVFPPATDHYNPPSAALDGLTPKNSADRSIPRFVLSPGRSHEVIYEYSEARTIGSVEVYWAEDAEVALPATWSLAWGDGLRWNKVDVNRYPNEKDQFNRVTFTPVKTKRIRLFVEPQRRRPAGILEWRVGQ